MAKPKRKYKVEVFANLIVIYTLDPYRDIGDIARIKGVVKAEIFTIINTLIQVVVSPLYSTEEIAREIEELLIAEVPEDFGGFDGLKFKD